MSRPDGLEYWQDGESFVHRLVDFPAVFSQGKTLDELRDNIQEVFELMADDTDAEDR